MIFDGKLELALHAALVSSFIAPANWGSYQAGLQTMDFGLMATLEVIISGKCIMWLTLPGLRGFGSSFFYSSKSELLKNQQNQLFPYNYNNITKD